MKRSCPWILTLAFAIAAPAVAADKAPDAKAAPAAKDPPKGDPAVSQALVEQYIGFFDKFVGYVEADQDNCDKMAKDLGAHLDASHALLVKAKAAHDAGKTLPPSAVEHMKSTMQRMAPGVQKCGSNEKVAAVLSKIPR